MARKAVVFVVLIVAVLLDQLSGNGQWIFRTLVCYFYIANEGVARDKTKGKAKEVLQVCQDILENKFISAEEVVKTVSNTPNYWKDKLITVRHLDILIINIVYKIEGKAYC